MDKCPFSGKPCHYEKQIHITDVKDLKEVSTVHCCKLCGQEAMNKPQAIAQELPEMGKYAMTLFEILQALIQNKFGGSPSQVILSNINPQLLINTKPPCPACGASLRDIAKTQRLGCSGCYSHYGKELLPVLAHAHKSCEHVGKSPKHRLVPKEEQIKLLELKLTQAIEHEKYEQAREIKTELDSLKAQ